MQLKAGLRIGFALQYRSETNSAELLVAHRRWFIMEKPAWQYITKVGEIFGFAALKKKNIFVLRIMKLL